MATTPHSNQSQSTPHRSQVVLSAQVHNSVFSVAVSIGEINVRWPPRLTLVAGVVSALLWLLPGDAKAVNKCTGADGKVTYQDAPCTNASKVEALKISADVPLTGMNAKQLPFKALPMTADEIRSTALADIGIAKRSLKDPDSAKFADVRVFRFEALSIIYTMTCGELNARNSYGGYVGAKPFWVYGGVFTQTFDHYLPSGKLQWLMGSTQTACLKSGNVVPNVN